MTPDNRTITLCAAMVGAAVQRDCPDLRDEDKFCAVIQGVHLMLTAGAYERGGRLFLTAEPMGTA